MAESRPITVVVPVYGDMPSLLRCVDALLATVNTEQDAVLLVNDCGPDADAIETALLSKIEGKRGFRYERNSRNLGFVGACNRAALELDTSGNDLLLLNSDTVPLEGWLDELRAVLAADPSHGIVCARSTNATIASLPFRLRDPASTRSLERSSQVSAALRERMPRYSYPPVAMGFCFLVRRELIDRFGLFDEIFAPGYGEENDFCLRMAQQGYRAVMAHRALVAHEGARSFLSARRARLRRAHEELLVKRHPDYPERVRQYLWCDIDPVDAFADVLVGEPTTPSVVIVADRVATIPHSLITRLQAHSRLSIMTARRTPARLRKRFGAVEWLLFGAEDGRVWDAAITPPKARATTLMRAAHAAPRTRVTTDTDLVEMIGAPVDDEALRASWDRNAQQMSHGGIPRPPRPRTRDRVRSAVERYLPGIIAARQRWTSRRK